MTTTKTRTRKPLEPATGSVRVLRPVGTVNEDAGEVSINGQAYYLACHKTGYRLHGYDPKRQQATCYDLPLDCSGCNCPDAAYRSSRPGGGCKHRKALAALLASAKLPRPGEYKLPEAF